MLEEHPEQLRKLKAVIPDGESITISSWEKEIADIKSKQNPLRDKLKGEINDLAFAEVLTYNRDNEQRECDNEAHKRKKEQERSHKPQRKHSYQER